MNVFLLPLDITKDIERNLLKFWWKSSQSSNSKLYWMSWDRMARHKSSGGLGFKNFRDFNLAMLGKQAWRFMCNPTSLMTRVYKARYFEETDFFHSMSGNNPSYIWCSILEARNINMAGSRWRLGSGERIRIAGQPWLL